MGESFRLCRRLFLAAIVACCCAPVSGSDSEQDGAAEQRGGLNHSLSLGDAAAASDSGLAEPTAKPSSDESSSPEQVDSIDPVETKPVVESRTLVRRPIGRPRSIELRGANVAWYRTGIGALAIVLGAVIGVFMLVRRLIPSARMADNGVLRVVGRTALTPKQHIALVRVGRRFVAVGVSADRVETLCEISDPDEVADLGVQAGTQATRGGSGFDEWLVREAASYPELSDQAIDGEGRQSIATAVPRTRNPLKELLHGLRKMKSR